MLKEKRLIDANALLDYFRNEQHESEVIEAVKDAPTVEVVEVVHGEWLDGCAVRNGIKVYDSIDCSLCEEVFKIESETREYWKNRFKVCPFCGAKMDGERKDNVGNK